MPSACCSICLGLVGASAAPVQVTVTMRVSTVRLSSVNVTATPTGTDPLNVTQATVQLSGKELQRALSTSLGQTLSKEPGMSTRFNGHLWVINMQYCVTLVTA